jgi:hypothetical protein
MSAEAHEIGEVAVGHKSIRLGAAIPFRIHRE